MKNRILLILLAAILLASQAYTQPITIANARTKAAGTTVTIKGIVTASELGTTKRYIQDNTAGIALYDSKVSALKNGDSVLVTGVNFFYNGELELDPVNSVTVLNTGNPIPQPRALSLSSGFSSTYLGQLIRVSGVRFTSTGTFIGNTNYNIEKSGTTKQVRILPSTNLPSKNIPSDVVDVIGIMSIYDNGSGPLYQLYPRGTGDIVVGSGPNINSVVKQTNIQTASFTLSFTTENSGSTIIKYGTMKTLELGSISDVSLTKTHTINLSNLNPATFYYVQAFSADLNGDSSKSGIYYYSTASLSSGDIKVYFNNTTDHTYSHGTDAITLATTIDDTLVAYIGRAKQTIDMAIYNLNNTGLSANISDALNNAANRGVTVRVVYDGSTANAGIGTLNSSVKKIISPQGSNYKIMHNKFLVFDAGSVDNAIVWTGSTNLTDDQVNSDYNNVIIIQDQALAKAYVLEFEEMWGSNTATPNAAVAKFGPYKTDNTPHLFSIDGSLVELYFSPSDGTNAKIIDAVNTADKDIYLATYVFTRTEIANPIVSRFQAGVYVAGLIGDTNGSNNTAFDVMAPYLDSNLKAYSGGGKIFHHKYAVIDQGAPWFDPIVITGSHNWSSSANTGNDENTLMIHDYTIANQYMQEWAKRFAEKGGTVKVGIQDDQEEITKLTPNFYKQGNQLILNYNSENNSECRIQLIDLNGKIIMDQNVKLTTGNNQYSYSIDKLKGIYLIRLVNGNSCTTGKLFLE